jgi:hypothetical protein
LQHRVTICSLGTPEASRSRSGCCAKHDLVCPFLPFLLPLLLPSLLTDLFCSQVMHTSFSPRLPRPRCRPRPGSAQALIGAARLPRYSNQCRLRQLRRLPLPMSPPVGHHPTRARFANGCYGPFTRDPLPRRRRSGGAGFWGQRVPVQDIP